MFHSYFHGNQAKWFRSHTYMYLVSYTLVLMHFWCHFQYVSTKIVWILPKVQAVKGFPKQQKQMIFFPFLFGYISKSELGSSDSFCLITSHIESFPFINWMKKQFSLCYYQHHSYQTLNTIILSGYLHSWRGASSEKACLVSVGHPRDPGDYWHMGNHRCHQDILL